MIQGRSLAPSCFALGLSVSQRTECHVLAEKEEETVSSWACSLSLEYPAGSPCSELSVRVPRVAVSLLFAQLLAVVVLVVQLVF